jgi:MFS transporter, YNFM family, putative membrane transport protein
MSSSHPLEAKCARQENPFLSLTWSSSRGALHLSKSSQRAKTMNSVKHLSASFAIFLCGCAAFLNLYSPQGILREIASAFHISVARASLSITATTFAVAVTAPFVNILIGRFEKRAVISFAAILSAAPALFAGSSGTFMAFLLARFSQGLVIPMLFAVTIAFIGEQKERWNVTEMTSFYVAGTTLGGFAGRFIANMMTAISTWRHGLVALGGITLILGIGICTLFPMSTAATVRPSERFQRTLSRVGLTQELKSPAIQAAFFVGACILFAQVTTFTYISLYLSQPPFRLNAAAIGSIYTVFLLAMIVTPIAGRLSKQRPHSDLLLAAMALGIIGALLTLRPTLPEILLGLALSSAGTFVAQTAANSFVAHTVRCARVAAVGLYLTSYYLGGSMGSIAPMPIWNRFGWHGCVALVILVQSLAIWIACVYWKPPADSTRL